MEGPRQNENHKSTFADVGSAAADAVVVVVVAAAVGAAVVET
jgi:hypothetical protein